MARTKSPKPFSSASLHSDFVMYQIADGAFCPSACAADAPINPASKMEAPIPRITNPPSPQVSHEDENAQVATEFIDGFLRRRERRAADKAADSRERGD